MSEVAGSSPVSPARGRLEYKFVNYKSNIDNFMTLFSTSFKAEYTPIFIFFIISFALAFVVFGLSYLLSTHKADSEKVSAYECGFSPFEDARGTFDVRFYLVSILFIIFDLEVSFLFPWAICLHHVTFIGFLAMFIFLLILTIGFVYEWRKGALNWE